jgi:hypothetical protein
MGIAHKAVGLHRCTFEVWNGDIDEEEVRAHLIRLAEDPDWPPGPLNLVDISTMGEVTVPDPDLVAPVREGTILGTELKTALIDPQGYALGLHTVRNSIVSMTRPGRVREPS